MSQAPPTNRSPRRRRLLRAAAALFVFVGVIVGVTVHLSLARTTMPPGVNAEGLSQDNSWALVSDISSYLSSSRGEPPTPNQVDPDVQKLYDDYGQDAQFLLALELEELVNRLSLGEEDALDLWMPLPSDSFALFHLHRTTDSLLPLQIAERHPSIQTYTGYAVTSAGHTVEIELTCSASHLSGQFFGRDFVGYMDAVDLDDDKLFLLYSLGKGDNSFSSRGPALNDDRVNVGGGARNFSCDSEVDEGPAPVSRRLQQVAVGLCVGEGDGICQPANNHAQCNFDGGDCCGAAVQFSNDDCIGERFDFNLCGCKDPQASKLFYKTYKVAIATTRDFVNYHVQRLGNNYDEDKESVALTIVVAALARVNGIYKRTIGVMLELAPNTTAAFELGDTTNFGGLTSRTVSSKSDQGFAVLNFESYDIGHILDRSKATSYASGRVCSSADNKRKKHNAFTTSMTPIGDAYYVDYLAHEIGHQLNATHVHSGCNGAQGIRVSHGAVEPGSGASIMSYAGICNQDNVAENSVPSFHAQSLQQIRDYITDPQTGGACGKVQPVNAPVLADKVGKKLLPIQFNQCVIPTNTAFRIHTTTSAVFPDAEPTDTIQYSIDQMDSAPLSRNLDGDYTDGPLFVHTGFTDLPERTFPPMEVLINEQEDPGHRLPLNDRILSFYFAAFVGFGVDAAPPNVATNLRAGERTSSGTSSFSNHVGEKFTIQVSGEPLALKQVTLTQEEVVCVLREGPSMTGLTYWLSENGGATFERLSVDTNPEKRQFRWQFKRGTVTSAILKVEAEPTPGCTYFFLHSIEPPYSSTSLLPIYATLVAAFAITIMAILYYRARSKGSPMTILASKNPMERGSEKPPVPFAVGPEVEILFDSTEPPRKSKEENVPGDNPNNDIPEDNLLEAIAIMGPPWASVTNTEQVSMIPHDNPETLERRSSFQWSENLTSTPVNHQGTTSDDSMGFPPLPEEVIDGDNEPPKRTTSTALSCKLS